MFVGEPIVVVVPVVLEELVQMSECSCPPESDRPECRCDHAEWQSVPVTGGLLGLVEVPVECHAHEPVPADPGCRVHVATDEAVEQRAGRIRRCPSAQLDMVLPDVFTPQGWCPPADPTSRLAVELVTGRALPKAAVPAVLRTAVKRHRRHPGVPPAARAGGQSDGAGSTHRQEQTRG